MYTRCDCACAIDNKVMPTRRIKLIGGPLDGARLTLSADVDRLPTEIILRWCRDGEPPSDALYGYDGWACVNRLARAVTAGRDPQSVPEVYRHIRRPLLAVSSSAADLASDHLMEQRR